VRSSLPQARPACLLEQLADLPILLRHAGETRRSAGCAGKR
jgi:hypothetical protein